MTAHFPGGAGLRFRLTEWDRTAGHAPRSRYADLYWTARLGPTAMLGWGRLVDALDHPQPVDVVELFHEIGVIKQDVMRKTLERLGRAWFVSRVDDGRLRVARLAVPLTSFDVARLPPRLQAIHAAETAVAS